MLTAAFIATLALGSPGELASARIDGGGGIAFADLHDDRSFPGPCFAATFRGHLTGGLRLSPSVLIYLAGSNRGDDDVTAWGFDGSIGLEYAWVIGEADLFLGLRGGVTDFNKTAAHVGPLLGASYSITPGFGLFVEASYTLVMSAGLNLHIFAGPTVSFE